MPPAAGIILVGSVLLIFVGFTVEFMIGFVLFSFEIGKLVIGTIDVGVAFGIVETLFGL